MCRIYAFHYKRIMEGIDLMKKNEYPKPKIKRPTMLQVRKRFNVLKYFYSGDKVIFHNFKLFLGYDSSKMEKL